MSLVDYDEMPVLCMQIEVESGPIPMALVQNKVDLIDQVRIDLRHTHIAQVCCRHRVQSCQSHKKHDWFL